MRRKFSRIAADYRSYRSYKKNHVSVPRIGSDDGYDYQKDNRNGEVDDYVKFVEQWRKDQAKSPKSGD
jgi:hypothetical protein